MRRIHWLLAGLAMAIGAGALAQVVPGGLPSNPSFQHVTVTAGVGKLCNGANATVLCVTNTGAHTSWAHVINAASNNSLGLYIQGMTSGGAVGDVLQEIDANNTPSFKALGDGQIQVNGFRVPRTSFGEFIGNAGGCSNNSGVWQTQNMGGTCTRNSTGNYTITFNTAYSGSPICVAQITSALAGIAGVNTAGTTSVTVQVGTTAFAAQDGSFFVRCDGFGT